MSTQKPNYPTEYRGNQIYDERRVRDLPDHLQLVQGSFDVRKILNENGIEHDPHSIVLEDSYNCLWINTENGAITEIWGIHKSVPYLDRYAVRLK